MESRPWTITLRTQRVTHSVHAVSCRRNRGERVRRRTTRSAYVQRARQRSAGRSPEPRELFPWLLLARERSPLGRVPLHTMTRAVSRALAASEDLISQADQTSGDEPTWIDFHHHAR